MLTPAQKHFDRVMAERRSNRGATTADRTAYEQVLFRLRMDKADLSRIQSNAGKAKLKSERLPDYLPWIDGALAADTGQADEVITTVMIWAADAGDIAQALRIGQYVLRHKIPMPDQYKRTTATVLVEEICDPILADFKANPAKASVSIDNLNALNGITTHEDMPDQVRAKLFKVMGYTVRLNQDVESQQLARSHLQEAIRLNAKIGVARDIELLDRNIKKLTAANGGEGEGDAPPVQPEAKPEAAKAAPEKAPRTTAARNQKNSQAKPAAKNKATRKTAKS
ncbi:MULTISPECIES: phage terminase small subunit [Lelliottia]|uniref:Terminase n=1 Tax=Lelliottia aquatilis TaxID=2080838 RepID=A0ABX5A529_9ENTR|nr:MULTISPECIES: phage terminase small subunit [Lelliottia]POZ24111.1 terminase [Lelliottia aquatilis]POZ27488.1 terminase [Lelliottia sp. 7254-16]POZ29759.1 terminase [Lelliottia aquatilis]POZ35324.1 terminase [Lelliottia aquatilis]POZ38885.1 terminase [Lelliottia aquatilis]